MKQWILDILGSWDASTAPRWLTISITALQVLLILLVAWLLSRISRRVIARLVGLSKNSKRIPLDERKADTILSISTYIVRVVIWFTAVVSILYQLGLSGTVGSLLATAGIGGIAIGFGAQTLIKDYIGGFFLILDNRMSVGDFVTVSGITGTVESLTLRTTQIRSFRGDLHTIPNGEIRQVTNMSRGGYLAVVDMSISYESDIDRACRILEDEATRWADENPDSVQEAPQVLGAISLGESEVVIRTLVKSVAPAHFAVERELRRRFKTRFDAEKIEIPYARRVVIHRKDLDVTE